MKKTNIILSVILIVVVFIFTLVVGPFISYWLAYFGGWIASLTIGGLLSDSLNNIFNTTYFNPENIPAIAALLGWIGVFFKSSITAKTISQKLSSDKKND